jgi:hypothetical protein
MSNLQIVTTPDGRALEYDGQQIPLPALPVDATVHAYATPGGLWVGIQKPGEPRPVYPGSGGQKLGGIELPADEQAKEQQRRAELVALIEPQRKVAEAQGVTVNGIRYAGDPSNRAALLEVIQFAREAQLTTFVSWKDSDSQFHANHPVADVEQALLAIAQRRSALIALEGQYAAQVLAGELDSVERLSWDV